MPTTVKTLIERLKVRILQRNVDNDDLQDAEALIYLNEASREIYRWCALYVPWLIEKEETINQFPQVTSTVTTQPYFYIRNVAVNGKPVPATGDMEPPYLKTYDPIGFDKIRLNSQTVKTGDAVAIAYVPAEILSLSVDGSGENETAHSIYPNPFDDILILAAMSAYETNRGMDSSPEDALKQKYFSQLQALYSETSPRKAVGEYYQAYQPRGYDL